MKLITGKCGKACIKIVLLCISLLAFDIGISYGQMTESPIILSKHELINANEEKTRGIYAEWVSSNQAYIEIRICNNSSDLFYLFTSYFDENLYQSPFLHRYDNKANECILSFLPIPYYMAFKRSDLIVVGEKRVITQFQVLYGFEQIKPMDSISLLFPNNSFSYAYVKDYDPQKMDKVTKPIFKQVKSLKDCVSKKMEFAVYRNIEWFNETSFYNDEYGFDAESKNYEIISINIIR